MSKVEVVGVDRDEPKDPAARAVEGAEVSRVEVEKATIPNDGSLGTLISAVVIDSDGAVVSGGVNVVFTIESGHGYLGLGQLDQSYTGATDDNGVASVYFYGADAHVGLVVVRASAEGGDSGKTLGVVVVTPIRAVTINNASEDDGWTLDPYDLEYPVVVHIPLYQGAKANDNIRLVWGSFSVELTLEYPEQLPISITIDSPAALRFGSYDVYYEVAEGASNISISASRKVTVLDLGSVARTLPRPICEEGEDDGFINIQDASNGVVVSFDYASVESGDFISFYWVPVDSKGGVIHGGSYMSSYIVGDDTERFEFELPMEIFFPGGVGIEGSVDSFYFVKKEYSNGMETFAVSFESHYRIDTIAPGGR